MDRRAFLCASLLGTVAAPVAAHTPYGQWAVYRRRHLIILTSKTDGPSYPLGQRVAELLAGRLPASKARVARAPHTGRVASLLRTGQMDVAVMHRDDAHALSRGRAPFDGNGPLALRAIVGLGSHVLVCRDDFPAAHAYLVAETLSEHGDDVGLAVAAAPLATSARDVAVPVHAGAAAYFAGEPPPAPESAPP